jgi:hypothetical protein
LQSLSVETMTGTIREMMVRGAPNSRDAPRSTSHYPSRLNPRWRPRGDPNSACRRGARLCGVMPLDPPHARSRAPHSRPAAEPNRFRGDAGAALEKLGNRELAKQNYRKLIALTAEADSGRPLVVAARRFVAANQARFRILSFVERHQIRQHDVVGGPG